MRQFKSHFMFSKKQRHGIFLLLSLIFVMQLIYLFIEIPSSEFKIDKKTLSKVTREIDSLKVVEQNRNKPRIYPFNPNYLTDFKASLLGMNNMEIDRLLAFRKRDKWINSKEQFQEVTRISDSLLDEISPFFKFPDWVEKRSNLPNNKINSSEQRNIAKQNINKATIADLQNVNGLGEVLSNRIVRYRNKFVHGFVTAAQLNDVYGLSPQVIENINKRFSIEPLEPINRIELNSATIEELVTIPYIDYDLAHNIVEDRKLRAGYRAYEELKKVKNFPINKIEIIELYLHLEKTIDE